MLHRIGFVRLVRQNTAPLISLSSYSCANTMCRPISTCRQKNAQKKESNSCRTTAGVPLLRLHVKLQYRSMCTHHIEKQKGKLNSNNH